MNNTIYRNYDATNSKKIQMYKDIFGEAPWNEGYICKSCGKLYPASYEGNCECPDPNLDEFYKDEELKESFGSQSMKNEYTELIAKTLDSEIGFMWGWNTDIQTINQDKLDLDEKNFEDLKQGIITLEPDFDFNNFFYLSEMGVKTQFRGQSIASTLYERLKNEINAKYILVRTTKKSDVPYKWLKKLGYNKVYDYNDQQDRCILILKLQSFS